MTFDNTQLRLAELLEVFFATHDPTTLNRQGADVGSQYRSAIYFHNDAQREVAEAAKLKAQADWDLPIVTEIKAFETFYEAEDYHQAYYELHREAPYCQAVIAPKLNKFKSKFSDKFNLR